MMQMLTKLATEDIYSADDLKESESHGGDKGLSPRIEDPPPTKTHKGKTRNAFAPGTQYHTASDAPSAEISQTIGMANRKLEVSITTSSATAPKPISGGPDSEFDNSQVPTSPGSPLSEDPWSDLESSSSITTAEIGTSNPGSRSQTPRLISAGSRHRRSGGGLARFDRTGWWVCCKDRREVNINLWGECCPDDQHQRCLECVGL
jgi:hypothetical protein